MKDVDSSASDALVKQTEVLNNKLPEFFSHKAGMELNLSGINLKYYRDFIYSAMARHYEIFSGDLVSKFKNIISISNEWLSVINFKSITISKLFIKNSNFGLWNLCWYRA